MYNTTLVFDPQHERTETAVDSKAPVSNAKPWFIGSMVIVRVLARCPFVVFGAELQQKIFSRIRILASRFVSGLNKPWKVSTQISAVPMVYEKDTPTTII